MRKQGFTLMELLVTIAIAAILAGIGVPYMAGYRNRAAAGVNEVNLLTTARQITLVREAFPGDLADIPLGHEIIAREEFLYLNTWQITAPSALGVTSGKNAVAAGTPMKAVLEENQVRTYYIGEATPVPPTEEVPEETTEETTEPATKPTIPAHICRDWNSDCRCDTEGCPEILHTETKWVEDGNCSKCGIHFLHRGMEDEVCNTCRLDAATGQTHVCIWPEGVCRCKCGDSRCDHGSTKTDKCPICGEYDYRMDPCPNCDQGI